jgi:FtsZ-binding cell division protein ZapB
MKKRFDNKIQELSNDNPTEADISTAYKMRKRQALLGQMDEEVFENLHPKNKMSFNPHMKLQLEIDSLKTKRNLQTHHTNVIDTKSTPSFLRRKYNNVSLLLFF